MVMFNSYVSLPGRVWSLPHHSSSKDSRGVPHASQGESRRVHVPTPRGFDRRTVWKNVSGELPWDFTRKNMWKERSKHMKNDDVTSKHMEKKHSLETKMRSSPVNMWKQMRISPVNMLETYDNFTSKHVTFSPVNTWTIIWGYHQ